MKIRFPQDPFASREQKKYKNPIPSREYITACITEQAKPISFKKLFDYLGLSTEQDSQALQYRLQAMVVAGQILQNRRGKYGSLQKMHLISGIVSVQRQGYGFVLSEDPKQKDIFLPPIQMRALLEGDKVLVYCEKKIKSGKIEGVVSEILERKYTEVTGRVENHPDGISWLVADAIKGRPRFIIVNKKSGLTVDTNADAVVIGKIIAYPTRETMGTVTLIKKLGQYLDPGVEIDMAIHAYNIPHEWPAAVLTAAQELSQQLNSCDDLKRTDLRDKAFITIDGEDAQDFDDAVFCEMKPSGEFILYVAIADVSYYVTLNSALDKEAKLRGNSVYFPSRVVPMLPEILSNDLCSLKPQKDRLAFVCQMHISANGELKYYDFYKAVIHSKARFTYTQVAAMLSDSCKIVNVTALQKKLLPNIQKLHTLYLQLLAQRMQRGAIDFHTKENQVIFTKQKKIKSIVPVIRTVAHRLIEECMLIANLAAANFVIQYQLPALFRNHAAPKDEKLAELRTFLHDFGLKITGGKEPKPKDYMDCLKKIGLRTDRDTLEMVVLRSLSQACYEPNNLGHFGLAFEHYVHFTSPIRRYADLLVHRLIAYKVENKSCPKILKDPEKLEALGKQISATEQRATEATRDVLLWLKCEYMQSKLGQIFNGRITGVTRFGLFVEIEEIFVEGLVHISSLKNDYYIFDQARHSLRGEQTNTQYTLGQKLTVLVAGVNVEARKIDYELYENGDSKQSKKTAIKKPSPGVKQQRKKFNLSIKKKSKKTAQSFKVKGKRK